MSATEESIPTLAQDDFDGIEPWLRRAAISSDPEEAEKSYLAFEEARKRYVDNKPTRSTWTPEEYGPVWNAGSAVLKQAKAEYDLATTRLLSAVRQNRLRRDEHGLGSLSAKLQEISSAKTSSETSQVEPLWEATLKAKDAELIDAFDALFRCILPTETLVESLGQGLQRIYTDGGDLRTASVKQAWSRIAHVWQDATSLLEARLDPFMDKLAAAIESEEAKRDHCL